MMNISTPNEEEYLSDSTLTGSSFTDLLQKRPQSSAAANYAKHSGTSLSQFLEKKSLFRKKHGKELSKSMRLPKRTTLKSSKLNSPFGVGSGDNIRQGKKENKVKVHSKADNTDGPSEPQVFPFKSTPSGNFKLRPSQIVYESKNLSIVAADPASVSLNITESETLKPEQDPKPHVENWPTTCLYTTVGKGNMVFSDIDTTSESDHGQRTSELSLAKMGYVFDNCVDWKEFTLPKKSDLKKMLLHNILNMINPDIHVKVGSNVYKCHRIVLQCYSSFFASKTASQVELSETAVPGDVFSLVYQWMLYTGTDSYKLLKRDNILQIFRAAQYLGIKELEDQCWAFVDNVDIFSEDKAFLLYLAARKVNNKAVMELMVPRVQRFFLTLVSSKEFVEFNSDEVCTFLESNYICVHCEEEVFMAAVRWLKHDWPHRKTHAAKVMSCIRFGLMDAKLLLSLRRDKSSKEFDTIIKIPEVSQMIEDGLSLQILKLCFNNESDESLEHSKQNLNLVDPPPRNWAGTDKCYKSYEEFMKDLSHYRSKQRLEIKKSRMKMQMERVDKDGFLSSAVLPPETQQKFRRLHTDQSLLMDCVPVRDCEPVRDCVPVDDCVTDLESREMSMLREMMCQDTLTEDTGKTMKTRLLSMASEEYDRYGSPANRNRLNYKKQQYSYKATPQNLRQHERRPKSPSLLEQDMAARKIQKAYRSYSSTKGSQIKSSSILLREHAAKQIQKAYRKYSARKLAERSHGSGGNKSNLRHWKSRSDPSLPSCLKRSSTYATRKKEGGILHLRKEKETVFVFGGSNPYDDSERAGKSIYSYHIESNDWRRVGEMPEPRHYHCVALFQGKIYVAGGKHPSRVLSEAGAVSRKVWKFDPQHGTWSRIRDMLIARRSFGLVPCNNKLYVIGGRNEQDSIIANVEKFDPFSNTWVSVAPMLLARAGAAITGFRGRIWVAGGLILDQNIGTNRVEYYNSRNNMWVECAGLRFSYAYAALVPANNRLFIVGGAIGLANNMLHGSGKQIDVWDQETEVWSIAATMSKPRHAHTAVYLAGAGPDEGYMFIMGGMSTQHDCVINQVDCWRVWDDHWIRGVAPLPTPMSGAASLVLPSKTFG